MALLAKVHRSRVRVSSDYARQHAAIVGIAASMILITTRVAQNVFAAEWHITTKGLRWLKEAEELK